MRSCLFYLKAKIINVFQTLNSKLVNFDMLRFSNLLALKKKDPNRIFKNLTYKRRKKIKSEKKREAFRYKK